MVHRTTGMAVLLPFVVSALCSMVDAKTTFTVYDPTKQKRRLRRYRQDAFQLPKRVTERRKGHYERNSYKKDEDYPPYLSDFYGYNEETPYPEGAEQPEDTYYPEETESPWDWYYYEDETGDSRKYSSTKIPTLFPTYAYDHEADVDVLNVDLPNADHPAYQYENPLPYAYEYGGAHPHDQGIPYDPGYAGHLPYYSSSKSKGGREKGYYSKVSYGYPKGSKVQGHPGHGSVSKGPNGEDAAITDPTGLKGGWDKGHKEQNHYENVVIHGCSSKSKSRKGSKGGNIRTGTQYDHYYHPEEVGYDNSGCLPSSKSAKGKGKAKKASKGRSKSKGKSKSYYDPYYPYKPTLRPTYTFGDVTAVPSDGGENQTATTQIPTASGPLIPSDDMNIPGDGGGGTLSPTFPGETLAPTFSPGEGTMAPSLAADNGGTEGTMESTNGAETQGPTSLNTIDLVPFGLLYDIDRDDIPPQDDYDAASALTVQYIDEYFAMTYPEGGMSVYTEGETIPGATAYSLLSGALRDFSGTATFSDAGAIPTPEDIDASLDTAFTQPNLQIALDLLATLPPENLFSTAVNIRKVENSEFAQMMMMKRQRQTSHFNVRRGLFTFAAAGMLGGIVYISLRFLQGRRARKRQKGAFFGGDDILLGDINNAYLVER